MTRYRAKPLEVEAVQWNGNSVTATPRWVKDAIDKAPGTPNSLFRVGQKIEVYDDVGERFTALPGDWLVWCPPVADQSGCLTTRTAAEFTRDFEPVPE